MHWHQSIVSCACGAFAVVSKIAIAGEWIAVIRQRKAGRMAPPSVALMAYDLPDAAGVFLIA